MPTGSGVPLTLGLNPPVGLTSGTWSGTVNVSPATVAEMEAELFYAKIHSEALVDGEIRGTLVVSGTTSAKRGTWGPDQDAVPLTRSGAIGTVAAARPYCGRRAARMRGLRLTG